MASTNKFYVQIKQALKLLFRDGLCDRGLQRWVCGFRGFVWLSHPVSWNLFCIASCSAPALLHNFTLSSWYSWAAPGAATAAVRWKAKCTNQCIFAKEMTKHSRTEQGRGCFTPFPRRRTHILVFEQLTTANAHGRTREHKLVTPHPAHST